MAASIPPVTLSNFTGLDFNEILAAETSASEIPIVDLENQVNSENTAISTLGTLGSDFTTLQNALTAINTSQTIPPVAATVASNAPFTASVTGAPIDNSYNVTVMQLATAETLASQGYASDTSTVGTGTLTLTIGATATPLTIDSSNDTLDGVASAINAASLGVTAQVVDTGAAGAPYRLELTSNATGASQAFAISSSLTGGTAPDFSANEIGPTVATGVTGSATPTVGGTYTGSLSQNYNFTVMAGGTLGTNPITIAYQSDSGENGTIVVPASYAPGTAINVADGLTLTLGAGTLNVGDQFSAAAFVPTVSTAQNAVVQVGNQLVSSTTNQVSNAIAGLTLNLTGTGGPASVSVAPDETAQGNQINAFVTAYNQLLTDINTNTQEVPNQSLPPLADDGGLRSMLFNLQYQLGTINLADLGISVNQSSGALSFSQSSYATAQSTDPTATSTALTQLYNAVNPSVSEALAPTTGLIATETSSDQAQVTSLNQQVTNLQNELAQQTAQLQSEYAQIQAAVANYQSLAQLFQPADSTSGTSGSTGLVAPGSNLTITG